MDLDGRRVVITGAARPSYDVAGTGPLGGPLVPAMQLGALATGAATRSPVSRPNGGVSAVLTSHKPVADSIQGPWISACLRWPRCLLEG